MSGLSPGDARWPRLLTERLGDAAPPNLWTLGNLDLLALPKTGIFCSAHCPGSVILRTYDQAAQWRDSGRCVISGFHSPVEKECLCILLRGSQPIIICPARALPKRIPPEWKKPLADGRLLLLSFFTNGPHRPTVETAQRRNILAAALADEVLIPYASPGGHLQSLIQMINSWGTLI